MKGARKVLLWTGRLVFWPIALSLVVTLAGNFLTAPLGFKSKDLPAFTSLLAWIAVGAWALSFFAKLGMADGHAEGIVARPDSRSSAPDLPATPTPAVKAAIADQNEEIYKDGWLATRAQHHRRDKGLKERKLSGERALSIHGDLIAEAKRLCAKEGLVCDEFGCPEPYKTWINDNSPTAKTKFEGAKRVAEAYRAILLEDLRKALGDELMFKLGEPEKYLYPQAGPGHGEVLAYCNLEFKHMDKSLFEGLPLPDDREPTRSNAGIIPHDRNIEVSHTASFGIFDPGFGEQYIPGDLRIIVGVKTVDDVTSYYSPWRYQVNPTANDFLKALVELESLPMGTSASS